MFLKLYLSEFENSSFSESLDNINKSMLAGEYYHKDAKIYLDKIEKILDSLKAKQIKKSDSPVSSEDASFINSQDNANDGVPLEDLLLNEDNNESIVLSNSHENIDPIINNHRKALDRCKKLVNRTLDNFEKIGEITEDPDTVHLHHNIDVEITKLDTKFEQNQESLDLILLHINLALIEIDEFLDCEGNTIAILRGYKEFFDKSKLTDIETAGQRIITKVLKDKIDYLTEKIAIRKNCSTKKHSEIKNEKVSNDNVFSPFYKLTLSHYQNTTLINLDYLKKLDKDTPFTNLQEVHLLNRKIRKFVYANNNLTQIDFKKITKFIDKWISLLEGKIKQDERYDEFA